MGNFQMALADFRQARNALTVRITRGLVAPVGPPRVGRRPLPRPPTWWFLLRPMPWFVLSDILLLIAGLILWGWKFGGSIQAAFDARIMMLGSFLWSFVRSFLVVIGILSPPPVTRWYSVFFLRVDLIIEFCRRLAIRLGLLPLPLLVPVFVLIWRRVLAWFAALVE